MEKRKHASVDLQREEKKQSTKAGPQCIGGIVSLLRRGEIFQCIALQDRSRVQSSVTAPLVSPIDSHILFASSCLWVYLYNHNTLEVALKLPSVKPARLSHMRSCVLWCQDCLAWDAVGDVILSNKRTVVPFQHLMKECLVGNGLSASRWLPVSDLRLDHH